MLTANVEVWKPLLCTVATGHVPVSDLKKTRTSAAVPPKPAPLKDKTEVEDGMYVAFVATTGAAATIAPSVPT
jgi:hypothetical protein